MALSRPAIQLRRVLGLPLLVFYGVGVTIGAGIFALLGEVVGTAGEYGPLAFLVACSIAATTAISYALLSGVYPKAAGEAVYVGQAFGPYVATFVGVALCLSAILSSAVISIAFAGYLGEIVDLPSAAMIVALLTLLALVAAAGVRESIGFAAILTMVEVGILIVLIYAGRELITGAVLDGSLFKLPSSSERWAMVFSAAMIAFFAFIGFEDIVNMAEETVSAKRVVPQAIIITLIITAVVYIAVATIATSLVERAEFSRSDAPMAFLFERITGYPGGSVAFLATLGMINGILVQIVMASRVIYGMARDHLLPNSLAQLHPRRRTPVRAILGIVVIVLILALVFPLVNLAQVTSSLILLVFTLVNASLWRIGCRSDAAPVLRAWRYWGLLSALCSACLLVVEGIRIAS